MGMGAKRLDEMTEAERQAEAQRIRAEVARRRIAVDALTAENAAALARLEQAAEELERFGQLRSRTA